MSEAMVDEENINFGVIPKELKKYPNWVNWTIEIRDDKPTKIPINPKTGGHAQSNNPSTWGTYEQAIQGYKECENNWIHGIGFMFSNGFSGTDFDHCRDPKTGKIEPWVMEAINTLNSYSEISQSKTGVHVLTIGKLPPGGRSKGLKDGKKIEMYDEGRFFIITGQHLQGTPIEICERQEEINSLHAEIFGNGQKMSTMVNKPSSTAPLSLSDADLIEKAKAASNGDKFTRLWIGDFSEYPSWSEADLALCCHLAFWTNKDAGRIDYLFRQSGLMREKWDEKHFGDGRTYGEETIRKAIEGTMQGYTQGTSKDEADPIIEVGIHLTDWGNAQRLVTNYSSNFRYCYDWNRFLIWDGSRWAIDVGAEINRLAKRVVVSIYREASKTQDRDRRQALAQFASRCESEAKIQAMIELVKSEPGVPIRPQELDQDPWILNVENGTIDLETGILRKPQREDLITKMAPVRYDPLAECPLWLAHLDKIMAGNQRLISFLQRGYGYSLTGITDERNLFIPWGGGANGKTTTHETISMILGEDYSTRTPTETLLIKRNEGIPNDLATLRGQRFVYASETGEDKKLAESLIKDLTGGDKIAARFMRAEWFTFRPTFKLWLATNHKPVIRGTDDAIWDRIRLIPFVVRIPESERIGHSKMFERFRPEHSGILRWLVKGCLEWQRAGLGIPQEISEATGRYREEMDLIGDFLKECCEISQRAEVLSAKLYEAYSNWCQKNGEKTISKIAFGKTLTERGFIAGKSIKGQRNWKGIALINDNA